MKKLLLLFCIITSLSLVLALETPDEYTAQEVFNHIEHNSEVKKRIASELMPIVATESEGRLRMLIDGNNWYEKRQSKFANKVTFGQPIKVNSPFQVDDATLALLRPSIEESTRYINKPLSHSDEANETEDLTKVTPVYLEKYKNYFLLPVLLENEFEGYLKVNSSKTDDFYNLFQRWYNPLNISYQQAESLLASLNTPVLYDLQYTSGLPDRESLFWVVDDKVLGAGSGRIFHLKDDANQPQLFSTLKPELFKPDWGGSTRLALKTNFELVNEGLYQSQSSPSLPRGLYVEYESTYSDIFTALQFIGLLLLAIIVLVEHAYKKRQLI